jgi:hypothetical protein
MTSVEQNCKDWAHNWFGFYVLGAEKEGGNYRFCDLPTVDMIVDSTWKYDHKRELVEYLKQSLFCAAPSLPSHHRCILCEEMLANDRYHWDGAWLWPSTLAHYVAVHSVRVPNRMLERIEELGFTPPPTDKAIRLEQLPWPPVLQMPSVWVRLKSFLERVTR